MKILLAALSVFLSPLLLAQGIFINEFMSDNTLLHDNYGETDDWVEIYNGTANTVNLKDYYLSDKEDNPVKWQISEDVLISPNDFTIIWLDGEEAQGPNHASFKLSSTGESLFLSKPVSGEITLISTAPPAPLERDISYGRITDGSSEWKAFASNSFSASNSSGMHLIQDNISFFPMPGATPPDSYISVSSEDPQNELRYTTDGSTPNSTSPLFTEPIQFTESLYFRVAAFSESGMSQVHDAFYYAEEKHQLPVIHLSIAPDNWTGEDYGIHIRGNNGIPGSCDGEGANWHRDWKRSVTLSWFDAEENFQDESKVKIGGGCSRNIVMKSLVFDFEGDTGLDFNFFPRHSRTGNFQKIKLRGSGHDFIQTHLRDAAIQEALRDRTAIDLMAYRPVVVYVNGTYYGVYNLREVMDAGYISTRYGIAAEAIDMIKLPFHETEREIRAGDDSALLELLAFTENSDLSVAENFRHFTELVDVENMTDYFIAQMYIANFDWPVNNMTMWRPRSENGKWRWMMYDLDASSSFGLWSQSNPFTNSWRHTLKPTEEQPEGTSFFAHVLQNETYRASFLQRLCTFGQTVLHAERQQHFIDSLAKDIAEEMPTHLDFWNTRPDTWGAGSPLGGSLESWEAEKAKFKDFFDFRFDAFTGILDRWANAERGLFKLNLRFDENTTGQVVLHQNATEVPYNYEGQYFKQQDLHIQAVPNSGYVFWYWAETGNTNASIILNTDTDTVLTPVFRRDPSRFKPRLYTISFTPNPTQRNLSIRFFSVADEKGVFRIYNQLGQEVFHIPVEMKTIPQTIDLDFAQQGSGVYYLEYRGESKGTIEKFVVVK